MIELRGVSKYYTLKGGVVVKALEDVDLDVSAGDFAMIFGRSGSGKTTLLSIIAGLTRPSKGEVKVAGLDLSLLNEDQKAKLRNEAIGFIFQYPTLIPSLTVIDNVKLPRFFSEDKGSDDEEALALLRAVGLEEKAEAYPSQLSAGQMRRVQIARALINNPRILLADEPTGELDEATELEIMGLLEEIHGRGVTVVMVSHTNELSKYANRLYKMEAGKLRELSRTP